MITGKLRCHGNQLIRMICQKYAEDGPKKTAQQPHEKTLKQKNISDELLISTKCHKNRYVAPLITYFHELTRNNTEAR